METDSYVYDAFGAVTSSTGTTSNDWLFTGEQRDGDSDLYFLRARYYDPETGRFLGRDPIEFAQRYAYAGNNPVAYTDPSGLEYEASTWGCYVPRTILPAEWATIGAACSKSQLEQASFLGDVSDGAEMIVNAADDVDRFVRNAPYSAYGYVQGQRHDADCQIDENLFVVCGDASGGFGRGGTTYGNVFVTGDSVAEVRGDPGLMDHEFGGGHSDQWRALGPAFPVVYGANEALGNLLPGPSSCWNVFELQAGLSDGGYNPAECPWSR